MSAASIDESMSVGDDGLTKRGEIREERRRALWARDRQREGAGVWWNVQLESQSIAERREATPVSNQPREQ
jgi:hypothetical protein